MRKEKFLRKAKRILMWFVVAIVVLAVSGGVYQTVATVIDRGNYPAPGQMVDVGGYSLHLYCVGENVAGSSTVILEPGLGATSTTWARVQPGIAQATRVCAYDRAGMGWSDPSPERRDAEQIATELRSLLQNAGIPGPYVLVGWSYGGLYARMFAGQYPDDVSGMVLLDASHPDQWSGTPAGLAQYGTFSRLYSIAPTLARLGVMRVQGLFQPDSGLPASHSGALKASYAATKDWDAQSAEFLASTATNEQVRRLPSLAGIPLAVLTATEHGTPPAMEQQWQDFQNEMALLSSNSVHEIVLGADHASFWLDPETVETSVAAILQVLEAAQTGGQVRQ